MKQVIESQSLRAVENSLRERIEGKELWGDIDLSLEDYENIRERLATILAYNGVDITYVCKEYPISLTSFFIFLARYKYDKNFWGLAGIELNYPLEGWGTYIGQIVRSTFKRYGFDFSDVNDEVHVNIAPILYEAGIPPESSLDDLFYILKYDSHTIFDPQLIIEDMVEMRSYHIRKPMLRFLKRFKGDRAVEFVLEVHDAMRCVDQNMAGESNYIGLYVEWKENEKNKKNSTNRKSQEFQTRPYFSFESGKKGLCLVLPRAILKNEWTEVAEWVICDENGHEIHKRMHVYGDEGRRYVESLTIPIFPANKYSVSLIDLESFDDKDLLSWELEGVSARGIMFFNAFGRQVTPTYLQQPFSTFVVEDSFKFLRSNNVLLSYQNYPTNRDGFKVVSVTPTGKNARVTYNYLGSVVDLVARPQVEMKLVANNLFDVPCSNGICLFTDIPELCLSVEDGAVLEGLNLRIGKYRKDLSENDVSNGIGIKLGKYKKELFAEYGVYSIRLYQDEHFIKQVEFAYVPKIKTNYSPIMSWPEELVRRKGKVVKFEKKDGWNLEFEDCVVNSDEENYLVDCPSGKGALHGMLKANMEEGGFCCSFELPINPFEIEIVDENGEVQEETTDKVVRLALENLNEKEYWLSIQSFGEYTNYHYSVRLKTANGVEQEESVSFLHGNCVNINLSQFNDTIRNCPLPAQIELYCEEEKRTLPLALVMDSVSFKQRPRYNGTHIILSVEDSGKDISLRRFGRQDITCSLLGSTAILGKQRVSIGYPCHNRLLAGLYLVEGISSNNIFEYSDNSEVVLTNSTDTLFISAKDPKAKVESFSDWLDRLIKNILETGRNKGIAELSAYRNIEWVKNVKNREIGELEYEELISLAFFYKDKCINEKKEQIKQCMRVISAYFLDAQKRLELVRILAEINVPNDVFDICVQEYNLMLLLTGEGDARYLADKLENRAPEIALILLMGIDEPIKNTIWREKYREIIGREAIRTLLSVPTEDDPLKIAEEQKRFLREQAPCSVRINLSNEISGDMEPIQKMIEYNGKTVYFNKAKKPDFGIYFDQIRFVDQYVNWYSLNHMRDGEMYPETRNLMVYTVKNSCESLMESLEALKTGGELGRMLTRYASVLRSRFSGDPMSGLNNNNYLRYFYLQGIAAFFAMMPPEYRKYGYAVREGEAFMTRAIQISPRIAKRDLLMAATFIYLSRKEEKLCR